jgi:hypothetical protein
MMQPMESQSILIDSVTQLCSIARGYFPALRFSFFLFLSFVLPILFIGKLPHWTLLLAQSGVGFGCYIGPLWRDPKIVESIFYGDALFMLKLACGLIGAAPALIIMTGLNFKSASAKLSLWVFTCGLLLFASGFVSYGALRGEEVSPKTIWGVTLTDMLPSRITAYFEAHKWREYRSFDAEHESH